MQSTTVFVDYYAIMDVPIETPVAELKAAYKQKALGLHPDKTSDPEATSQFQMLSQAWEVLGNAESRKAYDASYRQHHAPKPALVQNQVMTAEEFALFQSYSEAMLAEDRARKIAAYRIRRYQGELNRRTTRNRALDPVVILQTSNTRNSNFRTKAANLAYQRRLKVLKTEVKTNETAIKARKLQLDMVKAELVSLDAQDAIDMQLADSRQLNASPGAVSARNFRASMRTAHETNLRALTTEIELLSTRTAAAKDNFEHNFTAATRTIATRALRDLKDLRHYDAFEGYAEGKFAFWSAVRRATSLRTTVSGKPVGAAKKDLAVLAQYRCEVERPVVDERLVMGAGGLAHVTAQQAILGTLTHVGIGMGLGMGTAIIPQATGNAGQPVVVGAWMGAAGLVAQADIAQTVMTRVQVAVEEATQEYADLWAKEGLNEHFSLRRGFSGLDV